MPCTRCASDTLKKFDGELGIHFPGWEGLEQSLVLVYPTLTVCLNCGQTQFVIPAEQIQQLKNGIIPAQREKRASA